MERLIFKSPATASITYVEIDHEKKTYCTNYYRANGGWVPSKNVRQKDVKRAVEDCKTMGYTEI